MGVFFSLFRLKSFDRVFSRGVRLLLSWLMLRNFSGDWLSLRLWKVLMRESTKWPNSPKKFSFICVSLTKLYMRCYWLDWIDKKWSIAWDRVNCSGSLCLIVWILMVLDRMAFYLLSCSFSFSTTLRHLSMWETFFLTSCNNTKNLSDSYLYYLFLLRS
jgi:hypothetical protein